MDARAQAIERLYRERFGAFRNVAAAVVGPEHARDVVQEGFARALTHRRQLHRDASLEPWVWRIVLRAARESLARTARTSPEPEIELVATPVEADRALAEALGSLPPRRRLVVFLRHVADLSYADIAAVCEISEGTVAATLAQARRQLAEILEREGAIR
jgi:RNA polymerase sigma-70 factor (ECF subfamily)